MATPIWALAACTLRSAAATSGRRSSRVEGTPRGMGGGNAASGAGASENIAGGLPIRIAIACSVCARRTPTSMACASVLRSSVSAAAISALEATPLA